MQVQHEHRAPHASGRTQAATRNKRQSPRHPPACPKEEPPKGTRATRANQEDQECSPPGRRQPRKANATTASTLSSAFKALPGPPELPWGPLSPDRAPIQYPRLLSALHPKFTIMQIHLSKPWARRCVLLQQRGPSLQGGLVVCAGLWPSPASAAGPGAVAAWQLLPTLGVALGAQQTPAPGQQLVTKRTVFTELQSASMGYVCRESPKQRAVHPTDPARKNTGTNTDFTASLAQLRQEIHG